MANCKNCGKEIAWKWVSRPASDPRSPWTPAEPERDSSGAVQYRTVKNGKGKVTRRAVASERLHVCTGTGNPFDAPAPVPPVPPDTPNTPEPVPHTPDTPDTPSDSPAPVPPASVDPESIKAIVRGEMVKILDEYGVERPSLIIKIERPDGSSSQTGPDEVTHPMLPELVGYVSARTSAYVFGGAGSGKTFGCLQAARLCGLDATVVTMPGITPAKLLGYDRPDGTRVRTAFVDRFEFGGVVILDEFDRTMPAVAAALNSILENGTYSEGTRVITRHPDFVCLATGNTTMRGATRTYTSAQPLDLATAARFGFVAWGYDDATELAIVRSIIGKQAETLVAWLRRTREALKRDHTEDVFAGPRESIRIAQSLKRGVSLANAVDQWVWRGLDADIVARHYASNPLPRIATA